MTHIVQYIKTCVASHVRLEATKNDMNEATRGWDAKKWLHYYALS